MIANYLYWLIPSLLIHSYPIISYVFAHLAYRLIQKNSLLMKPKIIPRIIAINRLNKAYLIVKLIQVNSHNKIAMVYTPWNKNNPPNMIINVSKSIISAVYKLISVRKHATIL